MTVQDLAALQELTKDKHPGKWSENTALWSIVIILIILAVASICNSHFFALLEFAPFLSLSEIAPFLFSNAEF